MRFAENELKRMIEFIEWGINKGIKDKDLNSAYKKLKTLNNKKGVSHYITKTRMNSAGVDNFEYLSGLSEQCQGYVIEKVKMGEKNLYHSVMSVMGNRMRQGTFGTVEEEKLYYCLKYAIDKSERKYIEELIELCYGKVIRKSKVKKQKIS